MVLSLAAAAAAGPPGVWTRISTAGESGTDDLSLARTPDGVLHVLWEKHHGTLTDLMLTSILRNGTSLAPVPVLTNWSSVAGGVATQRDGSLVVLFTGFAPPSLASRFDNSQLYAATAPESGRGWNMGTAPVSAATQNPTGLVGVGVLRDGTLVDTFGGNQAHVGSNPNRGNLVTQSSCCSYDMDMAVDSVTGQAVAAWSSNASGASGTRVEVVAPVAGHAVTAPGSVVSGGNFQSPNEAVAVSPRLGAPGVYLAYMAGYPSTTAVDLWRFGASAPSLTVAAQNVARVTVAPGPAGRLWLAWAINNVLYVARTNKHVNRLGPVQVVSPPPGTQYVDDVRGDGTNGPLDLLVLSQGNGTEFWHTQVLPPLDLSATAAVFYAKSGAHVVFHATDVGDPVPGAEIAVAGHTLHTNRRGEAVWVVARGGKPHSWTAVARLAGYSASNGVRVEALPPPPPPAKA